LLTSCPTKVALNDDVECRFARPGPDDRPNNEFKEKRLRMSTVLTFLICIFGAICWFFLFILFASGAGPIGGADSKTWVVFLTPFGFFGPLITRLSRHKKKHAALSVLAFFPLLSIGVNAGLAVALFSIFDALRLNLPMPVWWSKEITVMVIAAVFWSAIAFGLIASGWTSPKDTTEQ
jgi:hypothetical protein